ncbi:DUF4190 domain-containing protein [Agromyces indicus]|uniref:DUF4190 domain-containing protein n=1 Tax=Agromyces indicus TaxID=758919 RepID=A0ABU1FPD6_9MICO|nr:DUF4190 domain-containing protein [Agromyces indicus]MDR5693150.1 DUF4190 domain-containing protein [Agromyces indicus]
MTTATDPMTTPTATSSPGDDASPYAVGSAPVVEEQRGFAISSLVLGLVSFVAGFTFVVPAAGLVLGILALKREPAARTMAIWGIVLNAVVLAGVAIAALATVAFGLFLLPFVPFAFI